jgi:hypothetical protein
LKPRVISAARPDPGLWLFLRTDHAGRNRAPLETPKQGSPAQTSSSWVTAAGPHTARTLAYNSALGMRGGGATPEGIAKNNNGNGHSSRLWVRARRLIRRTVRLESEASWGPAHRKVAAPAHAGSHDGLCRRSGQEAFISEANSFWAQTPSYRVTALKPSDRPGRRPQRPAASTGRYGTNTSSSCRTTPWSARR